MLACAGQLAGRSRFWTILQIREKSPLRNVELRITRHAHTHTHEYRRREAETVLSGSRRLKTYISLLSDRYTRPQVRVSTRNAGRQSLSVDFAHAETGCCNSLREVLQFALGLRQPFTWALAGVATWPWQAKPFTWALASAVTWFWCRANPFTWVLASVVTQPCVLNS